MKLFESVPSPRPCHAPPDARETAARPPRPGGIRDVFTPGVDHRVLEVYARARDPHDPLELRDLWLGRVEHELGGDALRPALAETWRASRPRRAVEAEEVLSSRATVRFVKELFNWFFRDDLYGELRDSARYILSSGSIDEERWGLPESLKECIRYALHRDWYGYSDSRGRVPAREAIAAYENARIEGVRYGTENVAITMGGTFAISTLADFVLHGGSRPAAPALCAIPNYPPLVETIARRHDVRLVPLASEGGQTSLEPLIAALTPDTPLVMLQTVGNPTGAAVAEADLARLIRAASPSTVIVLDECHEWLGDYEKRSADRAAPQVVRVSSLSKTWSAPGLKAGWFLADPTFIDEYYEYASSSFGGPPSFFYTVIEVLARLERWLITGVETPGPAEAKEFESSYDIDLARLRNAYRGYRVERLRRAEDLTVLRDAATVRLAEIPGRVLPPRFSINTAVELPGWDDSYRCFRDVLRETGVSVFPGILNFCLSGGVVRVTTARPWDELAPALDRLRIHAAPGLGG
ncbi:pyridoxal phosphate-dependent aminotransferase [Streptomyces rugosispiralis]|uniref:Pyridoxal phosphate-dependent aminotransferase n=1 Tax=Streptomyces rugosispiralis TaxID=2967341 RepID=A0ABT1USS3_9ACTN|nr:pyridoxal phosphate-dependent aminotransferase [Streptomyces rugosispiralis]MCQ8188153.1 pyridoxal phosphate-dependent aminotransferase [Streptomyces rugosispiralis]